MAHKKKDAPRKLYARSKVPFVCYAGLYYAPELMADSAIKLENGDVACVEVLDDDDNLVALEGTQTLEDGSTVTERMVPFHFDRKPRKSSEDSEDDQGDEDASAEESTEDALEADEETESDVVASAIAV